jgi:opacity protein-like surface antigen
MIEIRRSLIAFFPLVIASLIVASSSGAEENNYVVFKPGVYLPQLGKTKNFRTGFNFEVAFGHLFSPDVGTELEIGVLQTRYESSLSERNRTSFNFFPIAWSFKKLVAFKNGEYYGLGGFGVYYIRERESVAGRDIGRDRETDLGFHAGLGLHYNITPSLFLGFEGRYVFFKDRPFEKYNMDGVITTAFIGFRF